MKEIKLTQGKVALVDDDDFEYLNQWKWFYHQKYAERYLSKFSSRKLLLMHRVIINTPDGMETDHINNNGLDNRKYNLRICSKSENQHNSKIRKNNTSGYKGVTWSKSHKKWQAQLSMNRIKKYLGCFNKSVDAAIAYDNAAIKFYGNFACTNFKHE